MNLPTDSAKELFDILCVKYRKVLRVVDASEIDTILGVVYNTHHHREYCDTSSPNGFCLSEAPCSSSLQNDIDCLLEELRHVYQLLEEKGMSVDDIRKTLDNSGHDSRLVVDSHMSICFPDYDNKTVRFSRLQYALYRLFLNHPEGILLKQFPDYIDELRVIYVQSYKATGGNLNRTRMEEKLRNITDSTRHTIIEYLSRIRNRIITALGSDSLARHYYIRGTRNHSYRIILSREFVVESDCKGGFKRLYNPT